jgi:hypothetical protein
MAGARGHQTEGRKVSATDEKAHAPRSRAPKKTDLATLKKTATEKCDQPAALMARHGHQGEFVPVCERHGEAAIARSQAAGKKAIPKGTKKDDAAALAGANRDDELPLHRRPLTAVESESNLRCLNHLLGAQINA